MEATGATPLTEQVAKLVRSYTHGRVRNLRVEEAHGRVEIRGEVRTWHSKQLALTAALEKLSGDQLRERIVVVGVEGRAR